MKVYGDRTSPHHVRKLPVSPQEISEWLLQELNEEENTNEAFTSDFHTFNDEAPFLLRAMLELACDDQEALFGLLQVVRCDPRLTELFRKSLLCHIRLKKYSATFRLGGRQ
jgi:hypothetical protein